MMKGLKNMNLLKSFYIHYYYGHYREKSKEMDMVFRLTGHTFVFTKGWKKKLNKPVPHPYSNADTSEAIGTLARIPSATARARAILAGSESHFPAILSKSIMFSPFEWRLIDLILSNKNQHDNCTKNSKNVNFYYCNIKFLI